MARRRNTDLTPTQRAVRDAITALTAHLGYPPSYHEVAQRLRYRSTNSVASTLRRLRRKGVVAWQDGAKRTLRVVT